MRMLFKKKKLLVHTSQAIYYDTILSQFKPCFFLCIPRNIPIALHVKRGDPRKSYMSSHEKKETVNTHRKRYTYETARFRQKNCSNCQLDIPSTFLLPHIFSLVVPFLNFKFLRITLLRQIFFHAAACLMILFNAEIAKFNFFLSSLNQLCAILLLSSLFILYFTYFLHLMLPPPETTTTFFFCNCKLPFYNMNLIAPLVISCEKWR